MRRCLLLATLVLGVSTLRHMTVEHQWRSLEFDFPNSSYRSSLLRSGRFIPGAAVPVDIDKSQDGRVWMTAPRLVPGVPASLVAVGLGQTPLLHPYPGWAWHRQGDCHAITSVFRVQADRCGRLWAPDTGVVNSFRTFRRLCPTQLLVFDLASDQLVVRHRYPEAVLQALSLLVTIAVDIPAGAAGCRHAVAYVADVSGFALIAYSLHEHRSWRIESNYFYPYPRWGSFSIAGSSFDLMDGVVALALGPRMPLGDRILYFHSLASDSESWVLTSILRNPENFPNGTNLTPKSFHVFPGTRPSQAAAEAMDDKGVLFFSHLATNSLHCWNSRFSYTEPNFVEVDHDDEALQFASGMKVLDGLGDSQELWVVTSRLQKVATGTLDPGDINFRILRGSVRNLIEETNCELI